MSEAFPVLYWETLCWVCFLHRLQKVFRVLGMFTIVTMIRDRKERQEGVLVLVTSAVSGKS